MTKAVHFSRWLLRQKHRNDAIGELARSYSQAFHRSAGANLIFDDGYVYRGTTVNGFIHYLETQNATNDTKRAFAAAVQEWILHYWELSG